MRCISLWQPWASLIACGAKTIETRSWPTNYRGPLVIHAAKKILTVGERWNLGPIFWQAVEEHLDRATFEYPYGCIVATARLVNCVCFPACAQLVEVATRPNERIFGDCSAGRYAWILEDVVALPAPISFRGAQGLFDVPDELLKKGA